MGEKEKLEGRSPHPPFPRSGVVAGPWGRNVVPHHRREHSGPFLPTGPVLASHPELRLPSPWSLLASYLDCQFLHPPEDSMLLPFPAMVAPGCRALGTSQVQWTREDVVGSGVPSALLWLVLEASGGLGRLCPVDHFRSQQVFDRSSSLAFPKVVVSKPPCSVLVF